jgi:Tol biopolymer transport system component
MGLAWSPDGSQLGFVHRTDSASNLYLIDSDGRNLRQVYMSATEPQFIFSPNGEYLLIQIIDGTGEHLYVIDLSTLEPFLVQAPGIPLNDSWMWPMWVK